VEILKARDGNSACSASSMRTLLLALPLTALLSSHVPPNAEAAGVPDDSDLSPHRTGFVDRDGIRLHYLHWGGEGDVILLLAGLGNTAHVFDEFAPRLTSHFRVIGVTRRGYGESGRPASGYDTATLSRDILRLVDGLALTRVHLVGHSVAGDEMTRFAIDHPERVGSLVYLDAAYDRTAVRKMLMLGLLTNPRPPAPPRPRGDDVRSIDAFSAYLERVHGAPWPQGEILATRRASGSRRLAKDAVPRSTTLRVMRGTEAPPYRRLTRPALAVYAVQNSVGDAYPWIAHQGVPRRLTESALWLKVSGAPAPAPLNAWNWLHGRWRPFQTDQRQKFEAEAPDGRVAELEAPHFLFLARPEAVARLVREFLDGA
jgi:non-heme chloroperoxidase